MLFAKSKSTIRIRKAREETTMKTTRLTDKSYEITLCGLERRIYNGLIESGRSNSEASWEAFNYTKAWSEGEVDPETIMMITGMTREELRRVRR